ncbi:MAG TPA: SDR family NAD(P)-dependent oxidoreductase [Armatimonadota bacterium]|jgi:rhamnose utilization protein RhaD (predicted bifunctional aldolase and dehydrogenase)/NAD(P)-dependent dehydrogenase (short-subunit alcohol dehydrogenase family)
MNWPEGTSDQTPLAQLIALSRYYGSRPDIVLAGGGNTSLKTADRLFVKASGCALASVDEDGFVEMDRAALSALLAAEPPADPNERERVFKDAVMAARIHPEKGQRPSVEAALHHLLPSRFVVHSHATLANALTCCVNGEAIAADLFGDDVLWVPYVDPGYTLAAMAQRLLAEYTARTGRTGPDAILMANHGLIVGGETPDEVRAATDRILNAISKRLGAPKGFGAGSRVPGGTARRLIDVLAPALRGLLSKGDALKVVTFDDSPTALSLAGAIDGNVLASGGALTPDQIVYCKSFPLWFDPAPGEGASEHLERLRTSVAEHGRATGFPPKVILVRGLGLFAAGDSYAAADTVRQVYLDAIRVMEGAAALGGIRYMLRRDRKFIDAWEVESYRRQVAAGSGPSGRAAGKVAVVTGAAQGFGAGIAEDLAREGAHVALLDVNADGACALASKLCEERGPGRAIGIGVDVTSGDSLKDAIHAVVRVYGGLDLLISNAGVLRAGSVKTQPQAEFELVTRVNYVGYFNGVQAAAPAMAVQHMAKPDAWADIIQINSKSGLVGSNRNAAYAGGKFGGVGLTQSFALELVDDGVKVNAICPGNFFDGPLWSDPANGLFAQYLRTGKVPGANTVEDVKRAYESKVPMGRGCTVADVMKAVYYLMDQAYETGQALPVTGGQVMLS